MASPSTWVPPPSERSRNWLELPAELTSSILVRLGAVEVLMSARKVCKIWRQICSDPEMWRVVEISHSDYEKSPCILKHVVRKAVDLSCGQMVHLDLQIWGHPNNLLLYVFDRSSQLRRLYLFSSSNITSEWLSEMLKRLPLLEELHLECICHFKKAIEIAGRSCPQLKSLKLINNLYRRQKMRCDEDALAIAENMPGLRHLELCGPNKMTSDGLLAILENCPDLESLDVRHSVANIGPDLVKRLSQQIKDLRLSYDSCEDSDADNSDFLNEDDLYDQVSDDNIRDIRDATQRIDDTIQRVDQLEATMNTRFNILQADIDGKHEEVNKKLDAIFSFMKTLSTQQPVTDSSTKGEKELVQEKAAAARCHCYNFNSTISAKDKGK